MPIIHDDYGNAYGKNNPVPTSVVESLAILPVILSDTDISLPTDKQSILRQQAFLTTSNLGSAGTVNYIVDGLQYKRLTGRVFADQTGTITIFHGDDGTNWDTVPDTTIAVAANIPTKFDEIFYARFIKIVFTNGATIQTKFRFSGYPSVEQVMK